MPSNPIASSGALPTVDVVIPVLNEAHVLEASVGKLLAYLREQFPYPARVVIADNGSTDGTDALARQLAERYEDVATFSLGQRGRGRALRIAWTQSSADIVAYTDVDLSTDIEALEKLCRAIHEQGYEVATGSRLMRASQVTRSFKREVISRAYNLFIKCVLWTSFSDAQCGFKAASRRVIREIMPMIQDQAWFFDTELLVLCDKLGYPIKDVPVRWIEDPDTRVKIVSTSWEDIKGVFRLRRTLGRLRSQLRGVAGQDGSRPPVPGIDAFNRRVESPSRPDASTAVEAPLP